MEAWRKVIRGSWPEIGPKLHTEMEGDKKRLVVKVLQHVTVKFCDI
jgi:hypothetical protein